MFWGAPYWRFIHHFAMYDLKDLVLQVKNFIPCEECKSEWYDPAPEENLLDWSRELHNKVNTKLGRYDKWDKTDLLITHKPHCDVCEEKEFIHLYPWVFFHFVCMQPNSMDFLKAVNAQYPCDKHRGTFFDEPQPNETTIEWVVRNNQKVDPNFVKPSYMFPVPEQRLAFDQTTGHPILDPITGKQMVIINGGAPVPCSACTSMQQHVVQMPSTDSLPATITINQTVIMP